ncbi:MAG: dehalogenase [Thermoleophilia bacterium]|nr:dehalogenase [Thermoleophilia bacterium]
MDHLKYHDILYNDDPIGPWPTHLLKRVDSPTNDIVGPIDRRDERESAFGRSLLGEYGETIQREFMRMTARYPVGACLVDMQDHINTVRDKPNPVAPEKAPIPADPRVRSRHLKAMGYFLGADIMGIGPLAPSAVYARDMEGREVDAPFEYAIVFLCRKHDPTISASNGWEEIVDGASFQAYQRLAMQTETMADYLRRLGWEATASNANRYATLMPQIVLDAGLGEISRMGIILNPFLGCNFKAACVLTNMELETDGYIDFGLQEYCEHCALCAEQCPPQAIPRGPKTLYNGYYTWKLNSKACSDFDILNKEGCVCGRCTKVCPWHIPGQEPRDFAEWDGSLEWLHRRIDDQRARVVANDYVDPTERTQKWWFPLDEVDGKLVVPTAKNRHKICREHPLQNR